MREGIFNRQLDFSFLHRTVVVLGLCVVFLTTSQLFAAADIPKELLDTVRTDGTAEFFVVLEQQADISYAYELRSKEEKGKYVFDTLTKTAKETQAEIVKLLESSNTEYKSFWIQNMILVTGNESI